MSGTVATIGSIIMLDESCSEGADTDDLDSAERDRKGLSLGKQLSDCADFWSALHISGETGAADWATLEEMERQVTEAMYRKTPDISRVVSLTAEAFHRIAGNI
jgi:uncharacterized cupin superfamily protein